MRHPDASALLPGRLVAIPAAVAVVAESLAWALAATAGTLSPGWYANPRLLVAVHLLTLGTLALSIVGFGWQLVPVVTAAPPPRHWVRLAKGINGVLILGIALLCAGMGAPAPGMLAAAGATLTISALLLRSVTVVWALARASGRPAVRAWLVAAEACLWVGLGLGGALLSGRLGHALLPNPVNGIGWHASVLVLGWIGGWIGGLGSVLLPMFAVSPHPRPVLLWVAAVAWFGGIATGLPTLWFVGATVLVSSLLWSLHKRLARNGPTGLGVAAAGLSGLLVLGLLINHVASPALVALAIALFALPVLRGVGLRIAPFLVWSHHLADQLTKAPAVAHLVPLRAAAAAGLLSVVGGALVVAGLTTSLPVLARVGALLALVGTLSHGVVLVTSLGRAIRARNRLSAFPGMEQQ